MGRRKKADDANTDTGAVAEAAAQDQTQTPPVVTVGVGPAVIMEGVKLLHPDEIVVDEELNSRDSTGRVDDLVQGFLSVGQEQPIRVRLDDGVYHLVFGYRRHKAAKQICDQGLNGDSPFLLRSEVMECDAARAFEANMVENAQRKDLSVMETARACDRQVNEFGRTQRAVARMLGCSEGTVSKYLRLLQAPRPVQRLVAQNKATVEAVLEVLGQPEERRDEGFEALVEAAQEGKATRTTTAAKRKAKRGAADPEPAPENKALTLKQVKGFWQDLANAQAEEGEDSTAIVVAGWVVNHMQGKVGDRALGNRLAKLRLER